MGFRGQHKNKRDAIEPDVIDAIEARGIAVYTMDRPVDLLCTFNGANLLVEVKSGPKARLTPPQEKFFGWWPGQKVIISSVAEADAWAEMISRSPVD